ncbi:MAG: Uma2 family endonuclease [Planctomycetales bacterium]|jgi:Uma2 family endonuclease|nr:Uma2 family endonuclease [Planctomycetales bacterium]
MSSEAIRYQPRYMASDYRAWEGDWELWDGMAIHMSPSPGFEHQSAATRLAARFLMQLENCHSCECTVVSKLDWQISPYTVVRPDVSVLCEGHPGKFISYAPAVIAEILSPSTEGKDRTAKRDLYEQQGVRFYLLIDPRKKSAEVLVLNDSGRYGPQSIVDETISLEWGTDCLVSIPLNTVFTE